MTIEKLSVSYSRSGKTFAALNEVSMHLERGKIKAVVGESGSGKSTLALALIGLLPSNAIITGGEVRFRESLILSKDQADFDRVRGMHISMIFQEPLNSLNPVYRVGDQLAEAIDIRIKKNNTSDRGINLKPYDPSSFSPVMTSKARNFLSLFSRVKLTPEIHKEAVGLLNAVKIPDAENVLKKFPHELSGGMRQRVMIAMALAQRPEILIADEPTTALDVTTQAKVLALIRELALEYNTSVLFISHDLSVVQEIADDVAVVYLGEPVEQSTSHDIFARPLHPYTVGLLGSIPNTYVSEAQMKPIKGSIPDPSNPPTGCRFHSRCPKVFEDCINVRPRPIEYGGTLVQCHLYRENEKSR